MSELGNTLDKFILNEFRHSLCNYANTPTTSKGTLLTIRHAINTFYEGQFHNEGLCDISIRNVAYIPEHEWAKLREKLIRFIDNKLMELK